jgi:hypothetical protein
MAEPRSTGILSDNSLLQQSLVRLRRLMQEGFRGFLITISLFTGAAILFTIYSHDRAALEDAVRNETIQNVGTRQEPSDAAKELGLIATALAKVNSQPVLPEWECPISAPKPDPKCLPGQLVTQMMPEVLKAANSHLDADGEWTGTQDEIDSLGPPKGKTDALTWPELGEGSLCAGVGGGIYLMVPVQMRNLKSPLFSPRLAAAADISKAVLQPLVGFLKENQAQGDVVQAYFISPDSLLRIWSKPHTDFCSEFPKSRLWASKNYFAEFWEEAPKEQVPTAAYIDYGGNGLVRTACHAVEIPRSLPEHHKLLTEYPHGHFAGILCMDFKLPEGQIQLMRSQLFFEVADVSFPLHGTSDLQQVVVKVVTPQGEEKNGSGVETAGQAQTNRANLAETKDAPPGATAANAQETRKAELELREAIKMQPKKLDEGEIQRVLGELKFDPKKLPREITRLSYKGEAAFLLPLGTSGGTFRGLFFYPRSPRLGFWDNFFGILGLLLAGAGLASFVYSWQSQPKINELRKRISLFRNLQVGVVQVDPKDWIVECNDRAEELCHRRLPKPGFQLETPVNFQELFHLRVEEQGGGYRRVPAEEINRLRKSGRASSYYAHLSTVPKWLYVRATPIMLPQDVRSSTSEMKAEMPGEAGRRKARQMRLYGVFATISDVCEERIPHLDAILATPDGHEEAE